MSARGAISSFESLLRTARTVGAFRKRPERRYDYRGLLPGLLDAAGENVVAALIEDATRRRTKRELVRAVNRWLAQIGRVRLLPIRRLSQRARIYELRLRDLDSGRWANFADMGFGIGQALPVLVEGLRTPPGGILMVQEPEIHLHPDAQLAMADFLVDLVEGGRQVLVETHSENILLRVRNRLVSGRRQGRSARRLSPESVQLLYVDKAASGASNIRPIPVDALGQPVGWPSGFMEEATQERLAVMRALTSANESS
jgi:predicted ATPase